MHAFFVQTHGTHAVYESWNRLPHTRTVWVIVHCIEICFPSCLVEIYRIPWFSDSPLAASAAEIRPSVWISWLRASVTRPGRKMERLSGGTHIQHRVWWQNHTRTVIWIYQRRFFCWIWWCTWENHPRISNHADGKSPKTWGCGTPSKSPNSMAYKWGWS